MFCFNKKSAPIQTIRMGIRPSGRLKMTKTAGVISWPVNFGNLCNWLVVIILYVTSFSEMVLAAQPALYSNTFDIIENTQQPGKIVDGALQIICQEKGSSSRQIKLPVAEITDRYVALSARVKAQDVSEGPNSWNGIKVMLVLKTEDGVTYPQLPIPSGTWDWRKFEQLIRLPLGLREATLILGLEEVSGTVWFDEVTITLGRPPRNGRRYDNPFTGHDLDRLRGVMHGPNFQEENFRDLAGWRVNHIRWQLNWAPMKQAEEWSRDLERYDQWIETALTECDKALGAAGKYGFLVLVDLHCPPGGRRAGGVCDLFQDKRYQDYFLSLWERIARRYKGNPSVYAYDLLNEAVEGTVAPGLMDWRSLATEAGRRIRQIDPGKPLVFEPSPWGGPAGFAALKPLEMEGIIYSFHMYLPHQFTHQTIGTNPGGIEYPGKINGTLWNRDKLRDELMPVFEFQHDFNVHIYVGEFSAIRWAPGDSSLNWLQDAVGIFEQNQWDWCYHAYREWNGWSLEHSGDRNSHTRETIPNSRLKYMLVQFNKNQQARR